LLYLCQLYENNKVLTLVFNVKYNLNQQAFKFLDESYPVVSRRNKEGEERHNKRAIREYLEKNSSSSENDTPDIDVNERLRFHNWRRIRILELEILRLLQRSLTSAALTALAEWEDRDMMVAADRNYVIDYFERIIVIAEDDPDDPNGKKNTFSNQDFPCYLNFIEELRYEFRFNSSPAMDTLEQCRPYWDLATLRNIFINRQFEGIEIPTRIREGRTGNDNFNDQLFRRYLHFFTDYTGPGNGPNYAWSLANLQVAQTGNTQDVDRFERVVTMLQRNNINDIDAFCYRYYYDNVELFENFFPRS